MDYFARQLNKEQEIYCGCVLRNQYEAFYMSHLIAGCGGIVSL